MAEPVYTQWEYKVEILDLYVASPRMTLQGHLNRAGAEGWELISLNWEGGEHLARCVYKRPLDIPANSSD